jgi:hypothetical protein
MKRVFSGFAALAVASAISTAAIAQSNNYITPGEVANFNYYLDRHPALAQQLAANPSLVDNSTFLGNHPSLQRFLQNHPGVRAEIDQRPGQFMYREGHYEWTHGGPLATAPGLADGAVARFDRGYLDENPAVARQIATNPGLMDNPQFLAEHPGLDRYLSAHPEVRQELLTHPYAFMHSEWRDDHYGHGYGGINPGAVRRFDNGYLDENPQVAHQLGHDPRLVDNPQYLATHPGLDAYLASHPEVRTELQHHPDWFMTDEWRYQHYENRGNPLGSTDRYLASHPEVTQQLDHNPRLIDNSQFVDSHPGLREYLQTHPEARARWRSHPIRYLRHANHYRY